MTNWGEVLRTAREQKHWSVAYLADMADTSRKTIYTLEKQGGGKIDTYDKLFRAMGYELEVMRTDEWAICGLR